MSTKEGKKPKKPVDDIRTKRKKRKNKKFKVPNTKIWKKTLQKKKLVSRIYLNSIAR